MLARKTVVQCKRVPYRDIITLLAVIMTITGCATFQARPHTFEEAVRRSIPTEKKNQPFVIGVDNSGELMVAGRPTTLQEIERLREVSGLPVNRLAVQIRGDHETKHTDIKAIIDTLEKQGIWQISFLAIEKNKK